MRLSTKLIGALFFCGLLFTSCRKEVITENKSDKELLENTILSSDWKITQVVSFNDYSFVLDYRLTFNEDGTLLYSNDAINHVGEWVAFKDDRSEELVLDLSFSSLSEMKVVSGNWSVVHRTPLLISLSGDEGVISSMVIEKESI